MYKDYEIDLQGKRDKAEYAVVKIKETLEFYNKASSANAKKYCLQYSLNVLRSICIIVPKFDKHIDLYCDILLKTISSYLHPTSSPKHWEQLLQIIRYFHNALIEKKFYKEASSIYHFLSELDDKYQNENDYKHIFGTYAQHLLSQRSNNADVVKIQQECEHTINNITQLFNDMLALNEKLNFQYPELIENFIQFFLHKSSSVHMFIQRELPSDKTKMFNAFFQLLGNFKSAIPPKLELQQYCQRQLDAILTFLQYDIVDNMKELLLLQHLRACRDSILLKSDQQMNYSFTLLYYYVKAIYCLRDDAKEQTNFTVYSEICKKLIKFMEKSGETLIQHNWFINYLVILCALLCELHKRSNKCFETYRQQANHKKYVDGNFQLIMICVKLAPRIADTKILTFSCCNSVRKHLVINMAITALSACSYYAQSAQIGENKTTLEFPSTLLTIIHHAVNIIDLMPCINNTTHQLKILYASYAQLTRDVTTSFMAEICIQLAIQLVKIKEKFNNKDWTMLLRRIYKTAQLIDDKRVAAFIQTYYIASLMLDQTNNIVVVFNQIMIYYQNDGESTTKEYSITELYECNSPYKALKPLLNDAQKRYIQYIETQHICRFLRTNMKLVKSILRASQNDYEWLTIVSSCDIETQQMKRLTELYDELKKNSNNKLSRLQNLILAHVSFMIFSEKNETRKNTIIVDSKVLQEDHLENLLQTIDLKKINLNNEMLMIDIGLESLQNFQTFFDNADLELISSDIALIDWELILKHLALLAIHFNYYGYMEYTRNTWILHYRISNHIGDDVNSLRGFTYFCEYPEEFEQNDNSINLKHDIEIKIQYLYMELPKLTTLCKRQQNFILLALCQLAYYYAREEHFVYAEKLLQLVYLKHKELPEREKLYDVILATADVVKFRILWKHQFVNNNRKQPYIMQNCLIRELEAILERLKDIVYISTSDQHVYLILLFTFVQQFCECVGNRLCENFTSGYFLCILKLSLNSAATFRVLQMLISWMWINLQMENVHKAQIKMQLIECILGIKTVDEVLKAINSKIPSKENSKKIEFFNEDACLQPNPSMETVRRVASNVVSPIPKETLQLNLNETVSLDLKRYLNFENGNTTKDLYRWIYFMIGCMNARINYLIGEFNQLEDFYESSIKWLQQQRLTYSSIEILIMQHFINFLYTNKNYRKAIDWIEKGLIFCKNATKNIDSIYEINFRIQLQIMKKLINELEDSNYKRTTKLSRRALKFNLLADEGDIEDTIFKQPNMLKVQEKPEKTLPTIKIDTNICEKDIKLTKISTSENELKEKINSKTKVITDTKAKVNGNNKTIKSNGNLRRIQSDSCSLLNTNKLLMKTKQKDDLNACQIIDIVDLDDSNSSIINASIDTPSSSSSSSSPTNKSNAIDLEPIILNNCKVQTTKKTIKLSKVTKIEKNIIQEKTENCNQVICIDLDDIIKEKTQEKIVQKSIKSIANTNKTNPDLVEKFNALTVKDDRGKTTKTTKTTRVRSKPLTKQLSTPLLTTCVDEPKVSTIKKTKSTLTTAEVTTATAVSTRRGATTRSKCIATKANNENENPNDFAGPSTKDRKVTAAIRRRR